jgi:hypothetical protein
MKSKKLIIFLIFLGCICITIGITRNTNTCPPEKTIYRYVPRTFEEEQNEPVYVSDIFKQLFTQDSPWVRSANSYDERKLQEANKFFISQH